MREIFIISFSLFVGLNGFGQDSTNTVGAYKLKWKESKPKEGKHFNKTIRELNISFMFTPWYKGGSLLRIEKILPSILPIIFYGIVAYYFTMLFYLEIKELINKKKSN